MDLPFKFDCSNCGRRLFSLRRGEAGKILLDSKGFDISTPGGVVSTPQPIGCVKCGATSLLYETEFFSALAKKH